MLLGDIMEYVSFSYLGGLAAFDASCDHRS